MSAYYNEIDPGAAAWLRELIKAGAIAPGEVDERDIRDVCPRDLAGFKQCHFFAGIGVWSYALRLAGWPDDRAVWTGSCPCQPFSAAGRGAGFADERHLWPAWFHLIDECGPDVVFGEQVASKDGLAWLDLVLADLEGAGYSCGAIDLCAAGVGAPHIRQRLWIVAESGRERRQGLGLQLRERGSLAPVLEIGRGGEARALGNASSDGLRIGRRSAADLPDQPGHRPVSGFWLGADWIPCRDGKYRPVEPGTFPLAHGAPARVGRLRGYGNAIVAPLAAEVIRAYMGVAA